MSNKNLIIASSNQGKVKEIRDLLSGLGFNVMSMTEAGVDISIVEDQPDFAGNMTITCCKAYKRSFQN
jgi:XTP/dITP diphosphohydrolase